MALPIRIGDGKGEGLEAHVHRRNGDTGLVVFTDQLQVLESSTLPFLNDTFGNQMAIDVGFTGAASGIHDGGDTGALWIGSVLGGTWDFASATNPDTGSFCVDATATTNGDQALFTAPVTLDMTSFTAITGRIRLESWGNGVKDVTMRFQLAGVPVGNTVSIGDLIDTGVLNTYQSFAIAKDIFGLSIDIIDEMIIETVKSTGANPGYRLDNMQIESAGSPTVFVAEAPAGTKLFVDNINFLFTDALDTTLLNSSMFNLSHDQLLGVTELPIGIVIQRIQKEVIQFSASFSTLGDALSFGATIECLVSDGTNTFLALRATFTSPLLLDSRDNDRLTITINDDLSGLTSFTALVIGNTQDLDG